MSTAIGTKQAKGGFEEDLTAAKISEPLTKEIEQRAYELFLDRGGIDGNDVEDWLRAESEILEAKTNPLTI